VVDIASAERLVDPLHGLDVLIAHGRHSPVRDRVDQSVAAAERPAYGPRMAKDEQVLELLAQVPLFEGLSKADLKRIHGLSKPLEFSAGEDVVTQDGRGGRFYLIVEGEAVVTANGEQVATLGTGDHFGEMSLIDGEPRSATVTARTPLSTCTVASFHFRPLMLEHPTISHKLLVTMSKRIRRLSPDPCC
jgi:signal-transduction protein with cAMP-binding, CBS, and nucleotidyltransferase domain